MLKKSVRKIQTFLDDIWFYHILPTVRCAKMLTSKTGADEEIVEIAALLHDIASIKYNDVENHHISGAKEAERILKKL